MYNLFNGDCLNVMKNIPDSSVDCILCDLPYGSLASVVSDGWKNKDVDVSWDNLIDIDKLFYQYARVLRHNGALILFHKEPLTSELRIHRHKDIQLAHTYVWNKGTFSNPYVCHSAPLSVCENIDVYYKKYQSNVETEYDLYRNYILSSIADSKKVIIEKCGQGVDHFFRKRTKQFISEESYQKLIDVYSIDRLDKFLIWDELKRIILKCSRTFNIPDGEKYVLDLLSYPKDTNCIHPTQKPLNLLRYLIKIYSNENDTVLDNCIGSGSTGIASLIERRNFIGIELDKTYYSLAKNWIEKESRDIESRLF